jgi:hypothetical protein
LAPERVFKVHFPHAYKCTFFIGTSAQRWRPVSIPRNCLAGGRERSSAGGIPDMLGKYGQIYLGIASSGRTVLPEAQPTGLKSDVRAGKTPPEVWDWETVRTTGVSALTSARYNDE